MAAGWSLNGRGRARRSWVGDVFALPQFQPGSQCSPADCGYFHCSISWTSSMQFSSAPVRFHGDGLQCGPAAGRDFPGNSRLFSSRSVLPTLSSMCRLNLSAGQPSGSRVLNHSHSAGCSRPRPSSWPLSPTAIQMVAQPHVNHCAFQPAPQLRSTTSTQLGSSTNIVRQEKLPSVLEPIN